MLGKCNYLTIDVAQDEQQQQEQQHLLEATVREPTTHTQYVHTHAHRYTVCVCAEDALHLSLWHPQGRQFSGVVDLKLNSSKECKAIALRES